ncbi:MAG: glycosyltransferase [Gammaproteobacteria bacterium]|nr:glycosyltransferase [Gammaproteobacteria bacterium]
MRIIHVITGLATGGAEWALYNLLNGGIGDHFNCQVVSLVDQGVIGGQIKELGIPISALGLRNGHPSLSGVMGLRRAVRDFQPDVIQGWMYHGNVAASIARAMAIGRPALAWNVRHSLYDLSDEKSMTQKVIRLSRFISSGPDALLYNSRLSKKQHEAFGFSSDCGQVIPNGIDIQKFVFSSSSRRKVRSDLGISDSALVVGHVARLHPMKDHQLFLKAALDISRMGVDVHFLLSGRDVLIDNKNIEPLIPVELRNRFHLLGERADVPELMCAMDVFCQSSWSEAFPNVIGEAMATGLPCVATDVGDTKIIIGDTGVIVPAHDEKKLISGIVKLLQLTSQERRYLGEKVRARIETKFTLTAIVERYCALYEQLIYEKR